MSNPTRQIEQECTVEPHDCAAIKTIVHPRVTDLGGFSVKRALPTVRQRMVGPWVFFDHMGPAEFAAGEGINVRPHPHIGIATVTYLFEGEILHRDSLGSLQAIRPGDINLMVAGQGIVHSERERPEITATAHRLHGLQLWLALPEAQEEIEPAFYHYPSADIPALEVDSVAVRVMMGNAYAVQSPVRVFAETLYIEAHLQPGQTLRLPEAEERAVYVAKGSLSAQGSNIPEFSLAVFEDAPDVQITALEESRIAIIGGEKFNPRFMEWNFVSSRKERITQAKRDWKERRFANVPGDDVEFIPLPE